MDNFYVYATKRGRSNYIRQSDVRQKSEKFSAWEDFFLEQKLKNQKEDVEHFLKNA